MHRHPLLTPLFLLLFITLPLRADGLRVGTAVVDEATLRVALKRFGTIVSIDVSKSPAQVRFSTHEAARDAARSAAELILIAGGIGTLYNERSYDGRRGEAGRDDDDGRGW